MTDYTTISGNISAGTGGGINNDNGTITINATTITNNSAVGDGGGINNISNAVNLLSSIVAGNTSGAAGQDVAGANLASGGYNLIGQDDAGVFPAQATDLMGDAGLGPLADNGGPTQTHALLCGVSPAIDAGNPADTSAAQNGSAVEGGVRDIGAYESPTDCVIQDVPTLGEWSLIILTLLMLIVGVVSIRQKEKELAFS